METALICHRDSPARAIEAIHVSSDVVRGPSTLLFDVAGAGLLVPSIETPMRTDGLWQQTCFELFIRPMGSESYYEFNFSPSTRWAAYCFSSYRDGMIDQPLQPPEIEPVENGIRVALDLGELPVGPWCIGLSAVIEETDGTKSYWALRHPAGKPDFHHPDCFALELPASSAA